ncbi:MAG TPA: hypothetical protein VMJ10_18265 [Kofleriaceae bacterium]|nr:hypothetical protein [Kofleriaceae bacterium]
MRRLVCLALAASACHPTPPYATATNHSKLGPRSYVIDVELGKSDDFESAIAYANRRAGELCDSDYDWVSGERFSYSPDSCSHPVRSACPGTSSYAFIGRVECRWHGL